MKTTAYLKAIMEVYGKTNTGLGPCGHWRLIRQAKTYAKPQSWLSYVAAQLCLVFLFSSPLHHRLLFALWLGHILVVITLFCCNCHVWVTFIKCVCLTSLDPIELFWEVDVKIGFYWFKKYLYAFNDYHNPRRVQQCERSIERLLVWLFSYWTIASAC